MRKALCFLVCVVAMVLVSAFSDARYPPEWEWRTIRTEHFTIYYPNGHEAFAQRVLSLTDEVYADVVGYLGVKPRRCPIVLNPGADVFNGFYSPFPNRISLFETPLFRVRGFGPGSDIVDMVFTHEYTHFVHLTTRLGWYGALTRVIGDGATLSNAFSPGWIVEGITTNTETLFTDGGRGRCPYFMGAVRSFTEGKGLWGLSSAGLDSPHSPPRGRFYLAGYPMVAYLNRTCGEDAFAKLSRYQARHPIGGARSALKHVTKKSPRTFYRGFLEDFEARTQELKDRIWAEGLPSGKVLLSEPLDDFVSIFWTERGTLQALRMGYGKNAALVEVNAKTGEIIRERKTGRLLNLTPVRRIPDGRLVFGEVFLHPMGDGDLDVSDLVIFDPETNRHERLTRNEHVYSADLSPDGKTFVVARRNGMWIDLVLLDRDGSNLRPLVSRPGLLFEGPVWSPDGSVIAAAVKSGRNSDIVLIDPASGKVQTLFRTDLHEDREPSFSPDGRWIVFSSSRSGVWNIHAWDREEKKLTQLTSVLYSSGEPKVSPDGKTLAFKRMIRGVHRVCTLTFDPRAGKAVSVEAGTDVPSPDPTRVHPEVSFESRGFPLWEAYKPYIHTPWLSWDEEGAQVGMFFSGSDPVGIASYSATLLYGLTSKRLGYDLSLSNNSFWPTLSVRAHDRAELGNTLGGGGRFWFRERGGEVSLGLDILHRVTPTALTSSLFLGSRIRRFDSLSDNFQVHRDENLSVGVFAELMFERGPETAPRDMVSRWGQRFFISHEHGLSRFGGEIPGHNTIFSASQFIPSPLKHHGFDLTATCQQQNGLLYYNKFLSIPRGYFSDDEAGGLDLRKNFLMSLEYYFPILYTDRGLGLMLYHVNLVKGSLFAQCGAGWDGGFDVDSWTEKARTTVGASLTTRSSILGIPFEIGMAVGYKIREKERFSSLILEVLL